MMVICNEYLLTAFILICCHKHITKIRQIIRAQRKNQKCCVTNGHKDKIIHFTNFSIIFIAYRKYSNFLTPASNIGKEDFFGELR